MQQLKIVGVTKCPTGIAHTYMAAERLEKTGEKLGYKIQIETQGSQGTENLLSREIEEADYVIIAADIAVDGVERFAGKKVLEDADKTCIAKHRKSICQSGKRGRDDGENAGRRRGEHHGKRCLSCDEEGRAGGRLQQLMNGASYMIPFVVVGGDVHCLLPDLRQQSLVGGMVVFSDSWHRIKAIGDIAFAICIRFFPDSSLFPLPEEATFASAMIGAMIAMDGR